MKIKSMLIFAVPVLLGLGTLTAHADTIQNGVTVGAACADPAHPAAAQLFTAESKANDPADFGNCDGCDANSDVEAAQNQAVLQCKAAGYNTCDYFGRQDTPAKWHFGDLFKVDAKVQIIVKGYCRALDCSKTTNFVGKMAETRDGRTDNLDEAVDELEAAGVPSDSAKETAKADGLRQCQNAGFIDCKWTNDQQTTDRPTFLWLETYTGTCRDLNAPVVTNP